MHNPTKGYLLIFASVFVFGLFGLLTRIVSEYFPPFVISTFREGSAFLVMVFLTATGLFKWKKILKEDIPLVVLLGLTSMAGTVTMYYSFNNLPLGLNSSLVFGTSILFGWVIGTLFLKEKSTWAKILSLVLVVSGISIMFNIFSLKADQFNTVGTIAGTLFGFFSALYGALASKVKGDYGPIQLYTVVALIVSLVSLVVSLIMKEDIPKFELNKYWIWLFVFGLLSITANSLYIMGFKNKAEVSIVAMINPLQIIITSVTGLIFLNEGIELRTVIGGILILSASTIPYLSQRFTKAKASN